MSPLTRDEEVALARRVRAGDRDAESILIVRNLPLVKREAKRFRGRGIDRDDLVQIGTLGLMHAVRRYDPSRGFRLSTLAVRLIRNKLIDAVRKESRSRVECVDFDAFGHPTTCDPDLHDAPKRPDLQKAFDRCLDDEERQVLALKFGDIREQTYRQIGSLIGRSKQGVGRVHRRAVKKLRRQLAAAVA